MTKSIKELEGKVFTKAYHLADIHIRNLKRHKEYRKIFKKFISNVKKDKFKDALIYIAGDIAHAKTEMSPELVREVSWFLYECSKLHPTVLITGNHDCFTGDHEVLTKNGWISLLDYINAEHNDSVATFNANTQEISFQKPTSCIKKYYKGNLIHLKGKDVEQIVTPTHNILHTYSARPNTFYKKTADNIKLRTPIPLNGVVSNYIPNTYAQLLGFSFADGSFVIKNKTNGSGRIQFHLKKERKISYLCSLLDNLNYSYTVRKQDDDTVYINIYSDLAKDILSFFNGTKEIPISILNEDTNFHKSFISGYLEGDGNKLKSNYWRFSSIDKNSIDILFTLGRLCGYSSKLNTKEIYGNYKNSKQQYHASLTDSNKVRNSLITEINEVEYDDYVYCLSVPNENLLIRYNDKIFISGNCNQNNPSRLDTLSPIVDNINSDNIYYLRDTGVYQLGNLTFGVYSILSHRTEWPKGAEVKGEHKICLFHGPVDKSQTDVGYSVSSNKFTTDMFDGWDMAMLGDIHKRQQLQSYDTDNGKPVIVYAGSMIQQNHAEFIEKHGYLIWDIPNRTYTEVDIPNEYGYLTIDIVDNQIPQWVYDEVRTKLPKKPKIRARFSRTEVSNVKERVLELKSMFSASEITVTRTDALSGLKGNTQLDENIIGNVRDLEFQQSLLRDYLERKFMLDDEAIEKVLDINIQTNGKIQDADTSGNIVWYPKTFQFNNMFSYGDNNIVDFTKAEGLVGIFAPNQSGKSSVWDALSFCIFDKCSRAFKASHIMNNRKKQFYCKFHFEIDGVDYYIERLGRRKGKDGTNVKVDVNFWKEDGGTVQSLNGEHRRDTNRVIEQYLGKYEDFVLTTLSLQGNNALFIDKSQSERKDVLSQFIGVDVFDKLYNIAVEDNKETMTLIRRFNADDFTTKMADLNDRISEKETEYNTIETHLNDLRTTADKQNAELMETRDKLIKLSTDVKEDISTLEIKRKKLDDKVKKTEADFDLQSTDVSAHKKLDKSIDEVLDGYDEDQITKKRDDYHRSNETIRTLKHKLEMVEMNIKTVTKTIDHLDEHEYNPDCDICVKNSKSVIQNKETAKTELEKYQTEKETLTRQLDEETQLNEGLKEAQNDWQDFMAMRDRKRKVSSRLTSLIEAVSKTERDILTTKADLKTIDGQITTYYANEEAIEHNKGIQTEIDAVTKRIAKTKADIQQVERERLDVNGSLSSLRNEIQRIQERIEEVRQLEDQHKTFEFYLEAVGRNGISYELISKVIPVIEGEVNTILTQIVDFGLQMNMDGKNINAYLVHDTQQWPLEMSSGMERFISGLAIRVAMMNICNIPRPNFLVVDEGFGSLDSDNMTSMYMMFNYLKSQFDFVMIISHIDTMRDIVDKLIEIKKIGGYSNIKFK